MTEFWLISAPGEKTCQQTWDKMMAATTRTQNLSTNHKFSIPDLKVCTWFKVFVLRYNTLNYVTEQIIYKIHCPWILDEV